MRTRQTIIETRRIDVSARPSAPSSGDPLEAALAQGRISLRAYRRLIERRG